MSNNTHFSQAVVPILDVLVLANYLVEVRAIRTNPDEDIHPYGFKDPNDKVPFKGF